MKVFSSAALWLFVALVLAGCVSAKVTQLKPLQGEVQRPDRTIVYDFAATAPELRPEVAIAGEGAVSPPATQSRLSRWAVDLVRKPPGAL
jgi:hypothetical protein